MKLESLFEQPLPNKVGLNIVRNLVLDFNSTVGGTDAYFPIGYEDVGRQVWTRSDGKRLRKPGRIYANEKDRNYIQEFWNYLNSLPGVKSIGKVSREFTNDPFNEAVAYKNLYFAFDRNYGLIYWGSASRYKNPRSVWRHEGQQQ